MEQLKQKLRWLWRHPEVTWSGTGVYIVSLIVATGIAVVSWCFWPGESSPPPRPIELPANMNSVFVTVTPEVPSPVPPPAKSASTQGDGASAMVAGRDATVSYYGVPYEEYRKLGGQLDVTDAALASFFKILEEEQVPRSELADKLREIASKYRALLQLLETKHSEDHQIIRLKVKAWKAVKKGNYAKAEELLEKLEDMAPYYMNSMTASKIYVGLARLQEVQLRYAEAAEYWQEAAALLPEGEKKDRAYYLNAAGYDLDRIARYNDARPLYEQSLALYREIGDRAGEGETLDNIGQIYKARDYDKALTYLKQSLDIRREIGDRAGEAVTSGNIGLIYMKQGDLGKAEQYMSRAVEIEEELGHPSSEEWRETVEEVWVAFRDNSRKTVIIGNHLPPFFREFREVTVAQGENGNPVGVADNPSPIQNAVALLAKVMRGEEVNIQEASPSKFLINSGTEIAILDSDNSSEQPSTGFTDPIGFTQFVKIKILEGPYKDRTGWIHVSTIHHEQRKK